MVGLFRTKERQDKNFVVAAPDVVVRYFLTQDGKETDYVLFINKTPVGIIESKREEDIIKNKFFPVTLSAGW